MDANEAYWAEQNPAVVFIMGLQDLNQPYSCEQWGNQGVSGAPVIIEHDGHLFDLFHDSWNAFPTYVLIDHNMQVRAKPWTYDSNSNTNSCDGNNATMPGFGGGDTDDFLQYLVDECGSLCEECSGTVDSDGDGIADECDDCNNLSGDLNDDMVVDILDIVTTVNIILTGGMNSLDYTDCEKSDADFDGNGTINILDVIQIINLVLGNGLSLNDSLGSVDYVDVTYTKEGNDLFLTFGSKYAVGLEIALPGVISFAMIDASNQSDFTLATKNTNKCLIYSSMNNTFNNSSLTLQIPGGSEFNIKDINVIAGNDVGQEMPVRWLASEIHNFKIAKMYPNPFNPVTQIDYTVDQAGELRLSVYNILGQEVAVLHNGYQTEGEFKVTWDASSLSSGIYYMSMVMNGQIETMKAVLVK